MLFYEILFTIFFKNNNNLTIMSFLIKIFLITKLFNRKVRKDLRKGRKEFIFLPYNWKLYDREWIIKNCLELVYEDVKLNIGYRIDLLVEKKLVIEIKSVEVLHDLHLAQILTYLKLSNCKLGLLLNFNTVLFKNGIRRIANNL